MAGNQIYNLDREFNYVKEKCCTLTGRPLKLNSYLDQNSECPIPISKDTYLQYSKDEILEYSKRLVILYRRDQCFLPFRGFVFKNKSLNWVAVDRYGPSLFDILKGKGQHWFLERIPTTKGLCFSLMFIQIIKRILKGLKILEEADINYPMLSLKTIVFMEHDKDFKSPKLLDFFGTDSDKSNYWLLSSMIKRIVSKGGPKNLSTFLSLDVLNFLKTLEDPVVDIVKLIKHPALMSVGKRLDMVVSIRNKWSYYGLDAVFLYSKSPTWVTNWLNEANQVPLMKLSIDRNEFKKYHTGLGDMEGLIHCFRDSVEHMNHNIDDHNNLCQSISNEPKIQAARTIGVFQSVTTEEVIGMFEGLFPKLMCYLFKEIETKTWIELSNDVHYI